MPNDTVAVKRVGILERIRLFLNPPTSVQAACYDEPWVGVTEEWCGRVQQRFEHQERRAEAIKMLEEKASVLRGGTSDWAPSGAEMVQCMDGPAVALKPWGPNAKPEHFRKWDGCDHSRRVAEHVQFCCDCNSILQHNELAMVPPAELEGLRKMKEEMDAIALYLRGNFTREIERGDHAGRSDSAVIIGYLSRLKSS